MTDFAIQPLKWKNKTKNAIFDLKKKTHTQKKQQQKSFKPAHKMFFLLFMPSVKAQTSLGKCTASSEPSGR